MSSAKGWRLVIEMTDLTFRYAKEEPNILENCTIHVRKGDYVSVVGENGSGKSTMIRLFLGLLKPTAGTIERRARRTGYVPQKKDFLNSQFPLTVYEMLNSYRALLGLKDRSVVRESLERVRMEPFRNALVGTLSGGQAQKIFIARALIGEPDLLILDEPSTGVDPRSQEEIYTMIRTLNRDGGITVVSVEHNLDAAILNSTLIFHLANGKGHMCNPDKYAAEFLKKRPEAQNA
jgi:zinc transport system ATP-binding protein